MACDIYIIFLAGLAPKYLLLPSAYVTVRILLSSLYHKSLVLLKIVFVEYSFLNCQMQAKQSAITHINIILLYNCYTATVTHGNLQQYYSNLLYGQILLSNIHSNLQLHRNLLLYYTNITDQIYIAKFNVHLKFVESTIILPQDVHKPCYIVTSTVLLL